ncbi:conserved hypothetical protein [Luteimonas sp. 9C]|uniref:hypothetical protein n=1 Tax=Luteimonas sp. 9C TaxID=2653148 RepID=UPI0012EFDCF5|nr:hypothetical protein [Luteimonas sp. 9C]VXC20172.1 conserved hypothetical protein [Luteimonas sp. 9C]
MANVLDPISIVNQLREIAAAGGLPEQASPDQSELQDMAKELHAVGDRKGKDDYDKRLTALANDFLPDMSVEDRGRFIGAILENDPGATRSDSWLQGGRLDKLVDNGDITTAQRQQVLEAFGAAYTAGKADTENTWRFMEMDGVSGEVEMKGSERLISLGGGRVENNNTSGEVLERFLNGLGESDTRSSAFADFIETFTIDQLQAGTVGSTKTGSDDRGDYLGLLLNAADHAGDKHEVVNNILHGVDSEKRAQAIQDVSENFSKVTTDNAWLDREDSHLPDSYNRDPMEIIIRAVANDPSSVYAGDSRSHAADLAEVILDQSENNPWGDNGFFDDQNIPKAGRQEAVNELVTKKAGEIFEFNGLGESGIHDGSNITNTERNVQTMANLTRLTGLSPTNDAAPDVLQSLTKLSDGWAKDFVTAREDNNDDRMRVNELRLTHAVASTEQAVLNGFADKAEDDAARQADMMKMLNFFVGMVPSPGGVFTDNLKSGITKVFGENSGVTKIFDSASDSVSGVIDENSVDVFKDKMVELLGKSDYQDQYLAEFRENANSFIEDQLLRGLDGDGNVGIRSDIVKEASQLVKA